MLSELNDPNLCIESTQEFLSWYNNIDDKILEQFVYVYLEYYDQLNSKKTECDDLLAEVIYLYYLYHYKQLQFLKLQIDTTSSKGTIICVCA